MLRLICIDEVYPCVMFGCMFCPEFSSLKQSLFQCLHLNNENIPSINNSQFSIHLKAPLLLITATFNVELLSILQSMISVRIAPSLHLWSRRDGVQRRTLRTSASKSIQCLKSVKQTLTNLLSSNLDKKIIIWTKTSKKAENMKDEIDSWLNLTFAFEGMH